MAGYATLRAGEGTWNDLELRDLEGNPFPSEGIPKYVKTICFDGMGTGLYVLTYDDDTYFTCHSIHLDFVNDIEALKLISKYEY